MSKKEKRKYVVLEGCGLNCPKCSKQMERRERSFIPKKQDCYYREWDYCRGCKHLQHYEHFKVWNNQGLRDYIEQKEIEDNLFKNL